MDIIYQILDIILPFEFISYNFMKNAFLATLLITPVFAMLGTMAVNNKMAFFSDALGHSALTGIGIGTLLGLRNPFLSMLAFGIFLSIAITKVKQKSSSSSDTIISVFSSASMAIGIVILSKNGGFAKYSSYLVGDILTIKSHEIAIILFTLIIVYMIWYKIYNDLILISINTSLAASRGVKIALVENIFVILVSIVVMLSIKWIGILTINSMLILPAAAARNVSKNAHQYHVLSTIFGVVSGIFGLIASFYINTAAGATMVLIAAIIFTITFIIGRK